LTERINLATGIFLLPLRHPIAVARSIATLQDLAGGRFCFGVGAGWLEEEFRSLGVEFSERWSRLTEYVEAVRLLLSGDEVAFNGRYVTFDSVQLSAQPVEVPIVLGGNGAQALRRAARMADGWLSSGTPTLAEAEALRSDFERACESVGRRTAMPQWYRARFVDSSSLDDHEARGFDRVVLWADQLWPADGDLCSKRERFVQRVHDTGLSDRLGGGAIE
jgi:alkanesulfonate monooxygenase SsuD/methylene tetrahydromethanopterin reductase-like flavin-dependent oxidoreductase (luciferase family)